MIITIIIIVMVIIVMVMCHLLRPGHLEVATIILIITIIVDLAKTAVYRSWVGID